MDARVLIHAQYQKLKTLLNTSLSIQAAKLTPSAYMSRSIGSNTLARA